VESSFILIFILTAAISFAGSLQLGLVNLAVIKAGLFQSKKAARYIALGGCIPELAYSGIAVYAFGFLQNQPLLLERAHQLIAPILAALGIYFLIKKKQASPTLNPEKEKASFWTGLFYGTINPQLLPFWFGILLYLNSFELTQLHSDWDKLSFIIGTGTGALLLLLLLAELVNRKQALFLKYISHTNINLLLGYLFLVLAAFKFIRM
jgi:threonine/homoserine/homoserine lactone efflux protein